MDSRRKSIAKTVSWRIFGFLIAAAIVWALTGEFRFAATIGTTDMLVKLGLFYGHERVWNRVSMGRAKPRDYQI